MASRVRYKIVGATTLIAVIMYLDRVCIAEIAKLTEFKEALALSDKQAGAILSAFFFSYALAQVPAGFLSDRLGARTVLPIYVVVWSICTALTGLATGFAMLIAVRLLFGIAQAGCYPTASSLVKRWIPREKRGTASSIVSFGGRLGGAIAPVLTAWLLASFLGWRSVLALYGLFGLVVAAYFWWVYRDSAAVHPQCDNEERLLIAEGGNPNESHQLASFPPLVPLLRSGSMWLMCILQYGINIGWVFLVTWLPKYLQTIKQVDPKVGGLMSTIVLTAGIVGMLLGGPVADYAARRLGRRWGRSLVPFICYSLAIIAYLSCLRIESAWGFIAAACVVAFATDMSVPSLWAFMQDVGGKNTAAVFGWGNMWGNLGAATTPLVVPFILDAFDTNNDWQEVFWFFALGYLAAAIAALGINVHRTIE